MSALPTSFTSPSPTWSAVEEPTKEGPLFVNTNPVMSQLYSRTARIAAVDVPLLLLGESGTGKEVVARRIHSLSQRANRDFLKVNCAALPSELLESELFGYEAGAFTGATKPKPGLFELAGKGTILLDEIGEMPTTLQAKLLHVLQDRRFCRLGGRSLVAVDVRIMAATNIDVQQALKTKKLREDLYYRLCTFTIRIPPLRERREEIPALLQHFVRQFAPLLDRPAESLPQRIVDACMGYTWPGNVRELENFVRRFLVLGDVEGFASEVLHAGKRVKVQACADTSTSLEPRSDLKQIVRDLKTQAETKAIRRALESSKGKRREAAQLLNISTKALQQKIRMYGLATDGQSLGTGES